MNRFLSRLGLAVLVLAVLLLIGVVVARTLFMRYLHSEAFRGTLGQGAAAALQASHADFAPLDFDGPLVYSDNFRAERNDGGGFSSLSADQLRATFDWHGLLHHTIQIDELAIQRLTIEPPATGPAASTEIVTTPPTGPSPAPLAAGHAGWNVDLHKAVISEANWQWSTTVPGGISGAGVTLTPEKGTGGWDIAVQGGTLKEAGWPDLTLESASLRWNEPTLYINSSSLRNGESQLAVTGAIATRSSVDLHVIYSGVDVQPLLSPDWRQRLNGRLTGQTDIHAPLGGSGEEEARAITLSGSLTLIDGRLTALPILDQIGLFTHTERFRQVDLTRATADFNYDQATRRVDVHNMVIESAGLIRVEGDYTVQDGNILGNFQVGLTPETLQWIPGSQEQVFTVSRDGYLWTSMRLSGPLAHPNDDLTPRLVAAAGNEVIQGAEGVGGTVKKAAEGALDLLLH